MTVQVTVFTKPGYVKYTVPQDCELLFVECWGGGGGSSRDNLGTGKAGGGGGGGYAGAYVEVVAGKTIDGYVAPPAPGGFQGSGSHGNVTHFGTFGATGGSKSNGESDAPGGVPFGHFEYGYTGGAGKCNNAGNFGGSAATAFLGYGVEGSAKFSTGRSDITGGAGGRGAGGSPGGGGGGNLGKIAYSGARGQIRVVAFIGSNEYPRRGREARVAVQISGQQRYGDFFPQLMRSLSHFGEVDYFFHHWDGPRDADEIKRIVEEASSSFRVSTHTVRGIKIEPQVEFNVKPEWRSNDGHKIFHIMSMAYGIQEANNLRLTYEANTGATYDLVIRARSDIRLLNFPPDPSWLLNVPEKMIFVGTRPWYLRRGTPETQDQIAFGKPNTMDLYAKAYEGFDQFHAEGLWFTPEVYYYWWLEKNGFVMNEDIFTPEIEKGHLRPENRQIY